MKGTRYFIRTRRLGLLLCALCLCQCSKKKPPPERTEPWPAVPSAVASVALPSEGIDYEVGTGSRVWFELASRTDTQKGEISGVKGVFTLKFANVAESRASFHADLLMLRMLNDSGVPDATNTTQALNWLSLGGRQTAEVRERLRTATFTLSRADAGSQNLAALLGQAGSDTKTTRRANVTIKGELLLHGYRVPMQTDVELEFELPHPPNVTPDNLTIRSRRPLVVSLQTHDIKPRDESGTLLAKDLKTAGSRVGWDARVHFELQMQRIVGHDDSEKKP